MQAGCPQARTARTAAAETAGLVCTDASADDAAALVLHMQIFWPGERGFCLKAGAWHMAMHAQPVL